jgi:hypothetical protein
MKSTDTKPARGVYVPPGRRNQVTKEEKVAEIVEEEKKFEAKKPELVNEENPRKERGVYVPPGRRNLPSNDDRRDMPSSFEKGDSYTPREYVPTDWSAVDHEFKDYISNEKLDSCCLIIKDYPSSSSDRSREIEVRPYLALNCELKWISPQICILCFLNEAIANRALTCNQSSIYRPILLADYNARDSDIYTGKKLLQHYPSPSLFDSDFAFLSGPGFVLKAKTR